MVQQMVQQILSVARDNITFIKKMLPLIFFSRALVDSQRGFSTGDSQLSRSTYGGKDGLILKIMKLK
jgi:hypothetical protein